MRRRNRLQPSGSLGPVSPGPLDDPSLRLLVDQLGSAERISLALFLVQSVRDAGELSPRDDKRLAEAILALEASQSV